MKNYLLLSLAIMMFTLVGCSKDGMSGNKPPTVHVNIGDETYEATLGTYCWKNGCVDTVGPVELLEGKEPIIVEPRAVITLGMDYSRKPNEFHLTQITEDNENEIVMQDASFSAPINAGVYYYAYSVWWLDEKDEHLSNGDAFYAFSLQVE